MQYDVHVWLFFIWGMVLLALFAYFLHRFCVLYEGDMR